MKITLNLEFESIEQMHDWIVDQATVLMSGKAQVVPAVDTLAKQVEDPAPEPEPEPKTKPKRKRRTKAEMEAARAVAETSKGNGSKAPAASEPQPAAVEEAEEDVKRLEYLQRFRDAIAVNQVAAINELDKRGIQHFRDAKLPIQLDILETLERAV